MIERELSPADTPDGRPGFSVLLMTMGKDDLPKRLIERIGQTVLTCPTTACFDGLPDAPDRVGVGSALRFFGDGFQASKMIGGQRYWRMPVMEGEFLVQEKFGMAKGVGGGNFLMLARTADDALAAAEAAVDAMSSRTGVIMPFPGGVVRSGSKVGARRIKSMIASTNDAFAPPFARSPSPSCPKASTRCSRSSSTAPMPRSFPPPCAPASTPPAVKGSYRSPPATTAASSVRTTSIFERSWATGATA